MARFYASTTETGAYALNGATSDAALLAVTRSPLARYALPTEDEWYKAAYYDPTLNGEAGGYWDYATRSNSMSTVKANYDYVPGYVTDVGAYALPSYYGTFDQSGNVWEWNEAVITASGITFRDARGGSFSSIESGRLDAATRSSYIDTIDMPSANLVWMGFRIVEVPEPATLSLLALGGLALLRRKRP